MPRVLPVLIFTLIWMIFSCNSSAAAQVREDVVLSPKPAQYLSAFGLFKDQIRDIPSKGVLPYRIRNELFSDHAVKSRFVYVPEGMSANFQREEAFQFPVGSVLVKTFSFPADLRNPEKDLRKIETRLLLRQQDGWKAYGYVWNESQTDAALKIAGKRLQLEFKDIEGVTQTISYKVPNKNQCKGCHSIGKSIVPLGPKARNLNFVLEGAEENQLTNWIKLKILSGAPPSAEWPTVPDWRDENSLVAPRARAYLDVNCAHCHRRDGPAGNSGLFLTYGEKERVHWGYHKRPVAAGKGSGGFEFAIAPGEPGRSILLYRMKSTEPGIMMPELGRSLPDDRAIRLITRWISELD